MTELLAAEELHDAVRTVLVARSGGAIEIPDESGRGFDRALWDEMAGLGWLGLAISEAHGGLDLGMAHLGVLYEELGRELASVPILPTMIAARAISLSGPNDAKDRWLPEIAAGKCTAAIVLGAEGAASPLDANRHIDGSFDDVLFGDVADLLLIPARMGTGTALVAFEATIPGLSVEKRPLVDLTRSMARVELQQVGLDSGFVIPLDDEALQSLVDHAAVGLACESVGAAAALLERTVEYLQIREQFGRPIGSFQAVKHRMAEWKVKIEAATVLARHAAALLDSADADASSMASAAKCYACDTFAAFAGDSVQLHGGIGFTWEHPCHLFLKRAKLNQQLFGSSASHKDRVARMRFESKELAGTGSSSNAHFT
jgi:alkylation response protein AidB-like acyl-CoA dehydrogenase